MVSTRRSSFSVPSLPSSRVKSSGRPPIGKRAGSKLPPRPPKAPKAAPKAKPQLPPPSPPQQQSSASNNFLQNLNLADCSDLLSIPDPPSPPKNRRLSLPLQDLTNNSATKNSSSRSKKKRLAASPNLHNLEQQLDFSGPGDFSGGGPARRRRSLCHIPSSGDDSSTAASPASPPSRVMQSDLEVEKKRYVSSSSSRKKKKRRTSLSHGDLDFSAVEVPKVEHSSSSKRPRSQSLCVARATTGSIPSEKIRAKDSTRESFGMKKSARSNEPEDFVPYQKLSSSPPGSVDRVVKQTDTPTGLSDASFDEATETRSQINAVQESLSKRRRKRSQSFHVPHDQRANFFKSLPIDPPNNEEQTITKKPVEKHINSSDVANIHEMHVKEKHDSKNSITPELELDFSGAMDFGEVSDVKEVDVVVSKRHKKRSHSFHVRRDEGFLAKDFVCKDNQFTSSVEKENEESIDKRHNKRRSHSFHARRGGGEFVNTDTMDQLASTVEKVNEESSGRRRTCSRSFHVSRGGEEFVNTNTMDQLTSAVEKGNGESSGRRRSHSFHAPRGGEDFVNTDSVDQSTSAVEKESAAVETEQKLKSSDKSDWKRPKRQRRSFAVPQVDDDVTLDLSEAAGLFFDAKPAAKPDTAERRRNRRSFFVPLVAGTESQIAQQYDGKESSDEEGTEKLEKSNGVIAERRRKRQSLLLPSDAQLGGRNEVTAYFENLVKYGSNTKKEEQTPREPTVLETVDDEMTRIRKLVRSYTLLPVAERGSSEEAQSIEDLTGYPLVSRSPPGKEGAPEEVFQRRSALLTKLGPVVERMEQGKNDEKALYERKTGHRVEKVRSGRYRYFCNETNKRASPLEYQKIYLEQVKSLSQENGVAIRRFLRENDKQVWGGEDQSESEEIAVGQAKEASSNMEGTLHTEGDNDMDISTSPTEVEVDEASQQGGDDEPIEIVAAPTQAPKQEVLPLPPRDERSADPDTATAHRKLWDTIDDALKTYSLTVFAIKAAQE